MKVLSVNVGLPREVNWQGKLVTTGIFKEPVEGRIMMRTLNLDGDRQADLKVHGGPSKAIYAYPSEHYQFWRAEFPQMNLAWGMFGENFTTEGVIEDALYIGDRFRIGEAEVMATEPRMPCYKLGIKFGRADIIKRFLTSRRTGFYFAVVREGMVGEGDTLELAGREQQQISVAANARADAIARSCGGRFIARSHVNALHSTSLAASSFKRDDGAPATDATLAFGWARGQQNEPRIRLQVGFVATVVLGPPHVLQAGEQPPADDRVGDERRVERLHAGGDHGLLEDPRDRLAEAAELDLLAREGLDHAHAGDVLLGVGGHLGDALLDLLLRRAGAAAVAPGDDDHHLHRRQRDRGQAGVD